MPSKYTNDPQLGRWVSEQRGDKRRFDMPDNLRRRSVPAAMGERIKRLSELGFTWNVHPNWEIRLAQLEAFKNEHGHFSVPFYYKEIPGLGQWLSHVRRGYRVYMEAKEAGIPVSSFPRCRVLMSQDRIDQLEALGFDWSIPLGRPLPRSE